jgi:hypothetical protein
VAGAQLAELAISTAWRCLLGFWCTACVGLWCGGRRPRPRDGSGACVSAAAGAIDANCPPLVNPRLDDVRHLAAAATREAADRFAENTLPIVRRIQASGVTSLRGIAVALAARGIPTARGGAWNAMQVSNLLKRGK